MARNFLTPINLNGLELQDASIQGKTTSAINAITPASGGRLYYDSTLNVLKVYNGSSWLSVATGGSTFTLGSTSISIGGTTTTVAGLTLSGPTFSGTITTPLTTAGYVTNNGSGVLGSVVTIPNAGLTNSTISGISLGSNLATLTIGTGLSGTSYNGGTGVTIALASNYGDTQNPYASKTANYVLAAPNVSAGAPTFRALVSADIPTLGNITNAGAIGSTSGLVVSTTTSGVLTASSALPNGTTATTQAASNNSTHVATTAYVDTAVFNGQAGFNVHASVLAASTTNITGTYTAGSSDQSNGTGIGATFVFTAATVDGVTLATTNRVLLKDQTNKVHNGVYVVTTVSANITLTRASDFDNSVAGEVFNGDLIYIAGTGTQAGTTWVMNTQGTATTPAGAVKIGTDNINWVQFAGAGTYTGSNGVTVTGTAIAGANATSSTVGVSLFPTAQFTVTTGSVAITNLSASVILSGTLAAARGGTGADLSGANSTQYGIPYFSAAGVMASTAAGASTQVLIGNASGAPSWTNISGLSVSSATTATNANNVATTASTSASTFFPTFVASTTNGNQGIGNATNLTFVPSTGTLSSTVFSGSGASLTSLPAGNLTGTVSSARGITSGSTSGSFLAYNGTTAAAGQLDGGTTAPSGTTRLNYGGYLYATQFYGDGSNLTALAAGQLSGTIPTGVLGNSSLNIGTTSVTLNRGSADLALTGITSITGGTGTTAIALNTANTTSAASGAINVITGTTTTSGTTGATTLSTGNSAAVSGNVSIATGTGTTTGGITIQPGAGTTGGTVTINGGNGSTTKGSVLIGTNTNNTGSITIGATTVSASAFSQTITIGSLADVSTAPADTTVRGTNNQTAATTGSPRAGHLILRGGDATSAGASAKATGGDVWIDGGTYNTPLGAFGSVLIGQSATKDILMGSATVGVITIGNTSGAGAMTFGNSTQAQTVNIATGANSSSAKTLNLGTGGTGSTTAVNISTATGGTTTINGVTTHLGGKTTLAVHATGYAALNIPSAATTISSPASGDIWNLSGVLQFNTGAATKQIAFTDGNISGSAASVANSLVIKADSGTTEGTDLYTFNGSASKTLNLVSGTGITLAETSGTITFNNSGVTSVNGSSGAIGATANSNGAITRYYRATCAAATTTAINHGLGQWVLVQVYKTSDGTIADVDVTNTSTSGGTTTVGFATAPGAGDYTIVIIG